MNRSSRMHWPTSADRESAEYVRTNSKERQYAAHQGSPWKFLYAWRWATHRNPKMYHRRLPTRLRFLKDPFLKADAQRNGRWP